VSHAGIYDRAGRSLCEASGAAGLRRLPLARKHPDHKFQVYRYRGPRAGLGARAADIADKYIMAKIGRQFAWSGWDRTVFTEKGGGGSYDKTGCLVGGGLGWSFLGPGGKDALIILRRSYQRGELDFRFYCSNFVAACYQLAELELAGIEAPDRDAIERAITAIKLDYRNVSPKRLQAVFRRPDGPWQYHGNYFTSPRDYEPGAGTNLWTPDVFAEQTWHWSKDPDILDDIKYMLENYHGIPARESTRPQRAALLDQMLTAAVHAIRQGLRPERKPGIRTLIRLIEQEIVELRPGK
jgi:hypothetical protein